MSGSNTISGTNGGQPGVYGTLGFPETGNVPGARAISSSWVDRAGHLWLFGGFGYDANDNSNNLNDLWEYPTGTNTKPLTAVPEFSPGSGIYTSVQTLEHRGYTSGASIFYTIDGSIPTTSSSAYSAPFTVNQSTTINLWQWLRVTQALA